MAISSKQKNPGFEGYAKGGLVKGAKKKPRKRK